MKFLDYLAIVLFIIIVILIITLLYIVYPDLVIKFVIHIILISKIIEMIMLWAVKRIINIFKR